MADDSYKERQEDELQVLQAIFMGDVVDVRQKDAWKVHRPLELKLTLKPLQSMSNIAECYTHVDLVVKCPAKYPELLPKVTLENPKGLSNQQLADLNADLCKMAEDLKGEVMILELAQHVQQFLHANNKPPAKSFYEEMMSNIRKQEEKQAEEQQKKLEFLKMKEEKERQMLEGEIQRRQEALKEETKKRKEEQRQVYKSQDDDRPASDPSTSSAEGIVDFSPIGTPTMPHHRTRMSVSPSPAIVRSTSENTDQRTRRQRRTSTPRRNSSSDTSEHICKDHTGGIVVLAFNTKQERTIHRGTCMGHSSSGSTVCAGIDTSTGELVAISEWVLKWRHCSRKKIHRKDTEEHEKEAAVYLKQVISIEQELMSLIRLQHRNLIHYLAIKYQQEQGKIIVYLLMEHAGGISLNTNIKKNQPVSMDLVKSYAEEILLALQYLHNKDVVHKNLRPSSVFVDSSGKIRLADYSIERRLSDLFYTVEESRPGVHFTDNRPPLLGRGGKKGDIFQLGFLLLSISQGIWLMDPSSDIPTHFPPEFQDFLTKCLIKDDRTRWSVHQLLDHKFIKNNVPHHLTMSKPAVQAEKNKMESESSDDEEDGQPVVITTYEASGQSRLTNEFEILKLLGKGGFGDVIKVRNKLDRRFYAIKRIPLNPKSKQFNKKITREVKLLSRLNHENVVRYFNSWIETSDDPALSESSSSLSTTPKTTSSDKKSLMSKNTFDFLDDIEKMAPNRIDESVEWSMTYDVTGANQGQDSDTDDEDEADVFGSSFLKAVDCSEDIVFEHSTQQDEETKDFNMKSETTDEESSDIPKLQYLYIQMEYCEKSTLRNCIDAGLYQDMDRVWRLFREIVEGLLHIHEQGMIHRDLKPVNIFLDSNDQVKIGDFGLATTSIISKGNLLDATMLALSAADYMNSSSISVSTGEGDLTGKVGTALYVSPEMMTGASKIIYSQKVDIYSLGIIFFEMCYKPLPTGMERVKTLGNIRLKQINFPEDFDQYKLENQTCIIKWLLNHDASQRPSSKELLQSELLPPPQMEEAELNEILRSTISDPHSRAYHKMMGAIFSQTVNAADDVLYDSEFFKGGFGIKTYLMHQLVTDTLTKVFQHHGAVKVTSPLLMPKCNLYDQTDQYACFMDHSGHLVGIPFDLRIPFARFIARHNISHLKRYSIERVYREKKVYGQHPRELTECAFDIVASSPGSLIPDAELLIVIQEIINEFPVLQQRNYYVRMNHMSILRAILLHTGIAEEMHQKILHILAGPKIESQNRANIKALSNLGLNEQTVSSLLSILEMEGSHNKVASYLRCITKTRGPASTSAKQGLHELELIQINAETMGLKLQIIITLGFIYNAQQYSGMIFQVLFDAKKKKRNASDLLAVGGRYDNLVKKFHSPLQQSVSTANQSCVGVSIGFEKIVTAVMENREANLPSPYDILVCTIGHKPMLKERMTVVRDLWAAGLRAEILLDTMQAQEDIQDVCRSAGISYMVVLKDGESAKVRSLEKDKITEKKLLVSDVVEFLQQKLSSSKQEQSESNPTTTTKSTVTSNQPESNQSCSNSNVMLLNFNFIIQDGKLALNTRKKYEVQMYGRVTAAFSWLPGKSCEVIAVELGSAVLKCIAAFLEIDGSEKEFESSVATVMEKQPRHRKYLSKITDLIFNLVFEKKCNFMVLYGLKDDSTKLLT